MLIDLKWPKPREQALLLGEGEGRDFTAKLPTAGWAEFIRQLRCRVSLAVENV